MSLSGWDENKKLKLTIPAQSSELTDFPVLVNLASDSGVSNFDCSAVFEELGTSSKKIAIEIGDTGNQCYVEIENWDTDNAQLWVKVLTLSASVPTVLNLYYDSMQSDNTIYIGDTGDVPAQAVWDSNFVAVYHMAQDPSGGADCIFDSTSNANHCTPSGSMTSDDLVDSNIGKAIEFDGVDDEMASISNIGISGGAARSIDFVSKASGPKEAILSLGVDAIGCKYDIQTEDPVSSGFRAALNGGNRIWPLDLTTDVRYITIVLPLNDDMSNSLAYSDGELLTPTSTVVLTVNTTAASILLGESPAGGFNLNGTIDEVRVSDVVRDSSWVSATYLSNTDTLITFSTGITDRYIPAFTNFPKSYNIALMPDFRPNILIRQKRKGFSKAF